MNQNEPLRQQQQQQQQQRRTRSKYRHLTISNIYPLYDNYAVRRSRVNQILIADLTVIDRYLVLNIDGKDENLFIVT